MARGDPFEATVTRAARRGGAVVAPKGARIRGHIVGIIRSYPPAECIGLVLHPEWIEFDGREGGFAADQVPLPQFNGPYQEKPVCPFVAEPGTAVVSFIGTSFRVKGGRAVLWRTVEAKLAH